MAKAIFAVIIICLVIWGIGKIFGSDDHDDMDYSAY